MIGAIRRKFANPTEGDIWDTDQELRPEAESSELHTDNAVLLAAAQTAPGYFPGDENIMDYYKGIVRTAIENRGRYGDHWIPVPWLRMILAGLESRQIDPDLLWYEVDGESMVSSHSKVPSYEDLFPSESNPAARLR
jgi:hypothetical protein